ncbi:MAG: LppP/LprE family lipoprotein, partial [Alphaproteobacteria bacterium]|nr:LppP/LprE family lipoprotein [Alphaproteobacteria bacterium]
MRFRAALGMTCAALLVMAGSASAQQAAWLDSRPAAWNRAGMAVPTAPPDAPVAGLERCRERERAPAQAEEAAIAAAGWRLQEYWPTGRTGEIAVVTATAGYDGMCRPVSFNAFAFAGGRFAGTLAPAPMSSRTDGVLTTTPSVSAEAIAASFTRYAPSDPLCCPGRGHTDVGYR